MNLIFLTIKIIFLTMNLIFLTIKIVFLTMNLIFLTIKLIFLTIKIAFFVLLAASNTPKTGIVWRQHVFSDRFFLRSQNKLK